MSVKKLLMKGNRLFHADGSWHRKLSTEQRKHEARGFEDSETGNRHTDSSTCSKESIRIVLSIIALNSGDVK